MRRPRERILLYVRIVSTENVKRIHNVVLKKKIIITHGLKMCLIKNQQSIFREILRNKVVSISLAEL